ncbi:MAG: acyl-CoA dehydratase activase [Peptococcaceae bacterium]|jgi:predicted CoA-substrate-specific enzyme activase|nr:acyl-CoA dehydratase activase [Peptococcaceae bacterium]
MGSTAAKAVLLAADGREVLRREVLPAGWNSADTAAAMRGKLEALGYDLSAAKVVATGYGRVSIPYADAAVTEISCHGRGVSRLFGRDCTVLDIGGQDTKIISLKNGKVRDFRMNDKCAAGTGRFLEVMANTLGVTLEALFGLAEKGGGVRISSLCTVFAESEIVSLAGSGRSREDIAYGVCESIVEKVSALCGRHTADDIYFISGGLCESGYLRRRFAETLKAEVFSAPEARYAGALGAAILASEMEG